MGEKGDAIMAKMIGRNANGVLHQIRVDVEAELTRLGYARQDAGNLWAKTNLYGRVVARPDSVFLYVDFERNVLKPLVPFHFSDSEAGNQEELNFWETLIPGYRRRKFQKFEAGLKQLREEVDDVRRLIWNSLDDRSMEGFSTVELHWEDQDGIQWCDSLVYASSEEKELFDAGEFNDPRIESAQREALEARCS